MARGLPGSILVVLFLALVATAGCVLRAEPPWPCVEEPFEGLGEGRPTESPIFPPRTIRPDHGLTAVSVRWLDGATRAPIAQASVGQNVEVWVNFTTERAGRVSLSLWAEAYSGKLVILRGLDDEYASQGSYSVGGPFQVGLDRIKAVVPVLIVFNASVPEGGEWGGEWVPAAPPERLPVAATGAARVACVEWFVGDKQVRQASRGQEVEIRVTLEASEARFEDDVGASIGLDLPLAFDTTLAKIPEQRIALEPGSRTVLKHTFRPAGPMDARGVYASVWTASFWDCTYSSAYGDSPILEESDCARKISYEQRSYPPRLRLA